MRITRKVLSAAATWRTVFGVLMGDACGIGFNYVRDNDTATGDLE